MSYDNLKFWGSCRMAGMVKNSAKRKPGHNTRFTGSDTKGNHLHPVMLICFRYQPSGNLRIFLYPFIFNWTVLDYKRSPNSNWQWYMWLFKITFPIPTIDYVAGNLHKFLINLWTPWKCLSQAQFKWWRTKAIRQALLVKQALEQEPQILSIHYVLEYRQGISKWLYISLNKFSKLFPKQFNGEHTWIKSVFSHGLILACHYLREKNNTARIPKSFLCSIFWI